MCVVSFGRFEYPFSAYVQEELAGSHLKLVFGFRNGDDVRVTVFEIIWTSKYACLLYLGTAVCDVVCESVEEFYLPFHHLPSICTLYPVRNECDQNFFVVWRCNRRGSGSITSTGQGVVF